MCCNRHCSQRSEPGAPCLSLLFAQRKSVTTGPREHICGEAMSGLALLLMETGRFKESEELFLDVLQASALKPCCVETWSFQAPHLIALFAMIGGGENWYQPPSCAVSAFAGD